MKSIYDQYAFKASRYVTKTYSTSFYAGVRFLDSSIRNDVHAIYGFVRLADEIVDSFHDYPKEQLLAEFRADTFKAIELGISLNPILHSFQESVNNYRSLFSFAHRDSTNHLPNTECNQTCADLKSQCLNLR